MDFRKIFSGRKLIILRGTGDFQKTVLLDEMTHMSHPDSWEAGLGEPFLVVTPGGRLL